MDTQPHQSATSPTGPRRARRHTGLKIVGGVVVLFVLAVVIFLMLFDWDWLRGPISRYASARTGREVRIEGHLRVRLLTWSPTVRVEGLHVGNPAWAGSGETASMQALVVSARLLPLLTGHLDLPLLELDQPRFDLLSDAQGRQNWQFNTAAKSSKPAELPPIQRFVIRDGQITAKDIQRKITLTGTINAAEQASGGQRQGFELTGKGTINSAPFLLVATGGPLLNVQRSKPYPYLLDIRAGGTHVHADGRLTKPFNLGQADGELAMSGPNLRDLHALTGITLPATPAYSLTTHFVRDGERVQLTGIRGSVGESDMEGSLTYDKPNDRRTVTADLTSRRLVFADLLAVIGGGPKAGAVKADAKAPPPTPSGRLLPDAHLETAELREMDATLRYRAQSVETGQWPLRGFGLDLALDRGVLTMDPLEFDFPQGRLAGKVRIDARQDKPVTDLDMRLTNVALQQFLPGKAGAPPAIEGTLQARAQLHGIGDTIHTAASDADGKVVLVVPHGKMRKAFAELLGIDAANGLYLLLSKDNSDTDLRCAVAQFDVKGGVMTLDDAVFDTGVVRAQGSGSIDLGQETVDLSLLGKPKKVRLLRIGAPITIKGTLLQPKPGVNIGKAAPQIGVAAAVGVFLAPLAAVLPFVDGGLAKDADCVALLSEAKSQGAPVKASSVAAAAAAPQKK